MSLNRHKASIRGTFEPILRDNFLHDPTGELWLNWFRNSLVKYLREDYQFCKNGYSNHTKPLLYFLGEDIRVLYDELMGDDL